MMSQISLATLREPNLPSNEIGRNKAEQAEKAAQDFESIFAEMMLKSMRNTAKSEDESNAENIYQSMLDGEYAKNLAQNNSFGIRDLVLGWMRENDPALKGNVTSPHNPEGPNTEKQK